MAVNVVCDTHKYMHDFSGYGSLQGSHDINQSIRLLKPESFCLNFVLIDALRQQVMSCRDVASTSIDSYPK